MKTYTINPAENFNNPSFKNGQEMIWDSGAGFDVVVFREESKILAGEMADCQMKTGIKKGKVLPIKKEQLTEFSLYKWAEMRRKYDQVA